MAVKKKDFSARLRYHDSVSCWVVVLQETYQKFLDIEKPDQDVYNGEGGYPSDVFQAIYGRPATISGCGTINTIAVNAESIPMTLFTTDSPGELASRHAYTVHHAYDSHITLRNPWSVVNENEFGIPTNGGKDVQSLGNGVFEIPILSVVSQCNSLQYMDSPQERKRLLVREDLLTKRRPSGAYIIMGMALPCFVILATVSTIIIAKCLKCRRRETGTDDKSWKTRPCDRSWHPAPGSPR